MNSAAGLYDRGLVIYNPTKIDTPRFERAERQINFLSQSLEMLPLECLVTDASREVTQENILSIMRPSDLLILVGGDGTTSIAAEALLREDPDNRADLLSTTSGTSNDFARSLNGRLTRDNALARVLDEGTKVKIHPLRLSVDNGYDANLDRVALNNIGFNYTANVAHLLNEPDHRNGVFARVPTFGKLAQEVCTVLKSTEDMTAFSIYDYATDEEIRLLDRTFVHARTASKYGHFAISHLSNEFLDISTIKPTRTAVGVAAVRMMLAKSKYTRQTEVRFETGASTIRSHTDGETIPVLPYSEIKVNLDSDFFGTYTTRHA